MLRRVVSASVLAGLLSVPGAPPAAATTDHTVVVGDDGYLGVETYDTSMAVQVPDSKTVKVTAAAGTRQHTLTIVSPATLVPGSYAIGTAAGQTRVGTTSCGSFTAGTLTVTALTRAAGGAVETMSGDYDGTCGGTRMLGTVRFHTADDWAGLRTQRPLFPGTLVGGATTRDLTVTGTGTLPTTLGASSVPASAPYSIAADGCAGAVLDAGESCTVSVTYSPTAVGIAQSKVTTVADNARGSVVSLLYAEGVAAPNAPQNLRAVAGYDGIGLVWGQPAPKNGVPAITAYRVYRDGGADPVATVTGGKVSYADPAAPGSAHTYTVTAVAGDAGEGPATASAGATVPASVTEQAGTVTGYSSDYADGDFATATLTQPSFKTPGTVELRYSPNGFNSVYLTPAPGGAWAPGTMRLTYGGYGCGTGDYTVHEARVRADGTPEVLAVSGDAVCGATTSHFEIRYNAMTPLVAADTTPEAVESPATKPGTTAPPATVTVANRGSADLVLGTAAAPEHWQTTADTCSGATVAPGASCTLGVVFAPTSLGAKTGTLEIPDNTPSGRRRVRLTGQGTDVPGPIRNLTVTPLVGRVVVSFDPPENAYPADVSYTLYEAPTAAGPFEVGYLGGGTTHTRSTWHLGSTAASRYYEVRASNSSGEGAGTGVTVTLPRRELLYTAESGDGVYYLHARGLPGNGAVRLTDTAQDEEDPAVSSDGGLLAYTRQSGDSLHVYRGFADGSEPQLVAGNVGGVPWTYRNPQWSPDGTRLAYACKPLARDWYDLCVRTVPTGTQKVVVTGVRSGGAAWMPNGNELVLVADTAPSRLQVVARDGSYRKTIPGTSYARQVAVSPDGQRVAWTRYDGDEVSSATGTAPYYSLRVSPLSGGTGTVLEDVGVTNDPAWSADGDTVYYTHGLRDPGGGVVRDVWAAKAAGGAAPVRLTNTPAVDEDNVTVRDLATPPFAVRAPRQLADFTGDGKAEIAVFRPGTGGWYVRGLPTVVWGRMGDVPVPADYNGDRKADRAVFRPSTGTWHVYGKPTVKFGTRGDVPVPADYNGDGKADLAVYRPSNGTWYVYGRAGVPFGSPTDVPVPADYNGDRKADLAVFHPENGYWDVRNGISWEWRGSPAPADYLGTGRAQVAALHGTNWNVLESAAGTIATVTSSGNDLVAYGNMNGDRRVEPGVFNPTLGLWRVLGQANVTYGIAGDIPV